MVTFKYMELDSLLGRNNHVITNILLSVLQMTESRQPLQDQEKFQLYSSLWISKRLYKYCSFSYTLGLTITHWCTTVHHLKLTLDSKISSAMNTTLIKYVPFSLYTDDTSCNMRRKTKKTPKNNKTTKTKHTSEKNTNTPIHSAFISPTHFSGSEETTENHWKDLWTMINSLQNNIKADRYRELTIKRLEQWRAIHGKQRSRDEK